MSDTLCACGYYPDQPEHYFGCRFAEDDLSALRRARAELAYARERIAELEGLLAMRGQA